MKRISIGEIELAVVQQGQGVPLLLVHGFPLDHSMWAAQIQGLHDTCRVIAPDLRGCVLLLEEVGEEAYRVDRALTHLRMAGAFRDLAGILLGRFEIPRTPRRFPGDRDGDDLIREALEPLGVPVVSGLPVGHVSGKWTLPLGGRAEIDTSTRRVLFSP